MSLAAVVALLALGACITRESPSATTRCRLSSSREACEACCEDPALHDRTNVSRFNAPGDCRCVLRAWLFLQ